MSDAIGSQSTPSPARANTSDPSANASPPSAGAFADAFEPIVEDVVEEANALSSVAGHRWWIPLCAVGVGIVAQGAIWSRTIPANDRTYTIMSLLFVWPAVLFVVGLWWLFASGFSRWVRLGLVALAVLAISTIRVDTFEGDMVPRLRFAWQNNAERRALEYFARQKKAAANPEARSRADVAGTEAGGGGSEADPNVAAGAAEPQFTVTAADWPGFRGAGRDGVRDGLVLDRDWAARPPTQVWSHPIGLGWSSFAVVGDRFWTQEQRGPDEIVSCWELATGRELWTHADAVRLETGLGGTGPRATPAFSDGRIYALGASGLLNCLDARTGQKIWQRSILDDAGTRGTPVANLQWGMAGSPLVTEDLVIVAPGSLSDRGVLAYDRLTGEIRWSSGTFQGSYAAPRLETLGGISQLLVFHGEGIAGLRPEDGQSLWFSPWENQPRVNSIQPVKLSSNRLMIGCGYAVGSAVLSVEQGRSGNWSSVVEQQTNRFRPKLNDVILHDGLLYGLDEGVLACLNPENGRVLWRKGRYGFGQLLKVGELLLILSESGELSLVVPERETLNELAKVRVLDDATTWNHPVLRGDLLLVRNAQQVACYRLALVSAGFVGSDSSPSVAEPATPTADLSGSDPSPAAVGEGEAAPTNLETSADPVAPAAAPTGESPAAEASGETLPQN